MAEATRTSRRRRSLYRVRALVLASACALATACAHAPRSDADGQAVATEAPSRGAAALPPEHGPYIPTAAAARFPRRNGNGEVYDPWEPMNRRIHGFNLFVDRTIAQPLARFYRAVAPAPVRRGVGNFFANLYQPITTVHLLAQGRPRQAGSALLRFTLNTTLGLGGILDPATEIGLRQRNEDLGQTLGVWGWTESRYLVLPLVGPSTVRDGIGRAGDAPLNPLRQVSPERDQFLLHGVGLVDLRATLMDLGEYEEGTGDSYTLFRDTYLQRRRYQIGTDEDALPDYLFEDDFFDDDFD